MSESRQGSALRADNFTGTPDPWAVDLPLLAAAWAMAAVLEAVLLDRPYCTRQTVEEIEAALRAAGRLP